ncbi:hypothetical protein ACH5RR_015104 [Cinchona calisaya]|uniref:Uncharacterized protein n=1 Tax=Cinchona calisaya TaxID=153742 RepID=A0ABD2ZVM8_9GENT
MDDLGSSASRLLGEKRSLDCLESYKKDVRMAISIDNDRADNARGRVLVVKRVIGGVTSFGPRRKLDGSELRMMDSTTSIRWGVGEERSDEKGRCDRLMHDGFIGQLLFVELEDEVELYSALLAPEL